MYSGDKKRYYKPSADLRSRLGGRGMDVIIKRYSGKHQEIVFDCSLCNKISLSDTEISNHVNSYHHQSLLETRSQEKAAPQKIVFHREIFQPSQNEDSGLERALKKTNLKVIGLEYVIEFLRGFSYESIYRCVLCETSGVEKTIIHHLYSLSHCNRYLNKHFPVAQDYLNSFHFPKHAARDAIYHGCDRIIEAFGQIPPTILKFDEFLAHQSEYLEKVHNSYHFGENQLDKWFNVYDKKFMIELKMKSTSVKMQNEKKYKRKSDNSLISVDKRRRLHFEENEYDENNVVSICRILMSLEDITGSLSPFITKLLSDALKLEKYENRSVNEVLTVSANWIVFETVREKLKGHKMNNLVAPHLENLVDQAIYRIKDLLQTIPFIYEQTKNDTPADPKLRVDYKHNIEIDNIDSAMIDKLLKNIRNSSSCK